MVKKGADLHVAGLRAGSLCGADMDILASEHMPKLKQTLLPMASVSIHYNMSSIHYFA